MNGYNLIRDWYNYKFEHPSEVKAIHSDFYCYLVDQWNRLGQKKEFGLPTSVTMECLGIGSYNTYKKTLEDLVVFGFVEVVKKSVNQHHSKIVALSKNDKAQYKALDKATAIATDKATDTITKQINNEQINKTIKDKSLIVKSNNSLIIFLNKNCPTVQKLTNPLTDNEAEQILIDFPNKEKIKKVFLNMENKKDLLKKYKSANLTFRNWMKLESSSKSEIQTKKLNLINNLP